MTAERKHYSTLHGLRGVAAIIVAIYHLLPFILGVQAVTPGAYLAVDLFFLLSGFVLAHAYDRRLAEGMGFKAFALSRMIRLSPLYYLALLIALIDIGLGVVSGAHYSSTLWSSILAGLAWLPLPPHLSFEPNEMFPLNGPAWSLMFEVLINFAYALVGPRLGPRATAAVILASGVGLVMIALHYGDLNHGSSWPGAGAGLLRVIFSFSLGVLLCRLQGRIAFSTSSLLSLLVLAVAAMVLLLPVRPRIWFDLATVFFFWPAVIWFGARVEPGPWLRRGMEAMGDLSYALYALHAPLFGLAAVLMAFAFDQAWNQHSAAFAFGLMPLVVAFAFIAHHVYDAPLRRALNSCVRSHRKPSPAP